MLVIHMFNIQVNVFTWSQSIYDNHVNTFRTHLLVIPIFFYRTAYWIGLWATDPRSNCFQSEKYVERAGYGWMAHHINFRTGLRMSLVSAFLVLRSGACQLSGMTLHALGTSDIYVKEEVRKLHWFIDFFMFDAASNFEWSASEQKRSIKRDIKVSI